MGNPARKYVDLISKASGGKFANWDPPKSVEVGDWGHIDKDTASFVKEGNIFADPECSALIWDIENPVLRTDPEDTLSITANAKSAMLTIKDPYHVYLQRGIILPRLARISKLRGKAIVIETLKCPAYALLLSEKGIGGKASLALHTHSQGVGDVLRSGVGSKWESSTESGVWRTAIGYRPDGKDVEYTPLFVLKMPKRSWSRSRGVPAGPDPADDEDYLLPWDELDEDGEEAEEDDPMVPDF